MKRNRWLFLFALLPVFALLCGCSSLYTNYKDIEMLQVIQTLGIDRGENGGVVLSVASGANVNGGEPTVMSITAPSIETAMEKLQENSARTPFFFAHTQFLVIGEDAARSGISAYLDYIRHMPLLRTDVRLFLVRGCDAKTLVTGAADGKYDISDELSSLLLDLEHQNGMQVFTCAEVSRYLMENGASLACAIDAVDTEGIVFSGSRGLSAVSAGYGVLADGALLGYILGDAARGIDLLSGSLSGGPIALESESGIVTVQLHDGKTTLSPVWDAAGNMTGLRAEATVSAEIAEVSDPEAAEQPGFSDSIADLLARRAENWLRETLDFSSTLGADFLSLGERLERQNARRFRAMPRAWSETLPLLRYDVCVKVEITGGHKTGTPSDMREQRNGGTE